jgi:hypothetical protein
MARRFSLALAAALLWACCATGARPDATLARGGGGGGRREGLAGSARRRLLQSDVVQFERQQSGTISTRIVGGVQARTPRPSQGLPEAASFKL